MVSGCSVVAMSVPSRLFSPAAAMLPMSQPMALKASVAPAADPDPAVTAVPAVDSADRTEACDASTMTLPSAASTRVSITWAWIEPVSWFHANRPPSARLKPSASPSGAGGSLASSSGLVASASSSTAGSMTAMDSVTAPSSAAPLAITERSAASITDRSAEASIARSTVLLAEAMPTLMSSSIGTSAEKPALRALNTVESRASTDTGPGATTSTSTSAAFVAPRPLLAATLALEPCVAPDRAYTASEAASSSVCVTRAWTLSVTSTVCTPIRLEMTEPKTPAASGSSPRPGGASTEAAATWTRPAPAPSTPCTETARTLSPSSAWVSRNRLIRLRPASKPWKPRPDATADARLSTVSSTAWKRLRSTASISSPPGSAMPASVPLSAASIVIEAPPATPARVTCSEESSTSPPAAAFSTSSRFSVKATTSTDAARMTASGPIHDRARVWTDRSVIASGTSPERTTSVATHASSTNSPPMSTAPSISISAACVTVSSSVLPRWAWALRITLPPVVSLSPRSRRMDSASTNSEACPRSALSRMT